MADRQVGGFTLIELLIVIAIILILIAIALPNFLEAQIRAKVARVLADHRSIVTAVESYQIDHKDYMPYDRWGSHGQPRYFNALTTPIRYFTNADTVSDPFFDVEIDQYQGRDRYGYYSDGVKGGRPSQAWIDIAARLRFSRLPGFTGVRYCITSSGPDTVLQIDGGPPIFYSPTNGTKSIGDILRFGP